MDSPAVEYVALDLETTGLSAETERIVEVGAVRFNALGEELDRYQTLVNPERRMPPGALAVHGITDDQLVGAPRARDVLPEFFAFLGAPHETILLAHNASFDARFLGCECRRTGLAAPGHAVADTLALARKKLPGIRNHRLDTLARLFKLDPDGPHRALADSIRVKGLWMALDGRSLPAASLVSYPILGTQGVPVPTGWDGLIDAMARGLCVNLEYEGGTRGSSPRMITPRGFIHKGGTSYLVAYCHLDLSEKSFRLDRVVKYEVVIRQSAIPASAQII